MSRRSIKNGSPPLASSCCHPHTPQAEPGPRETGHHGLQAQTDLTAAESELLTQSIAFRRNQLTLLQVTGELLDERNVVVQ